MSKVTITLKKSVIGSKPDQVATVKALGLKKTNSSVEQELRLKVCFIKYAIW